MLAWVVNLICLHHEFWDGPGFHPGTYPLLDPAKIRLFADGNYVFAKAIKHRRLLTNDMSAKLTLIIKWFKDSGLKVIESKTELCLFQRKYQPPVEFEIKNMMLTSKHSMNVLRMAFNSKLNWQTHIKNIITKSIKALNAIKLICRYLRRTNF